MTTGQNIPLVSVIVPVYNDGERLRSCLLALKQQTYPTDRYEVIVVDNGSAEPLDSAVSDSSAARLLTEEQPGSYAARNRGIAAASGEVLAFTDSDCVPDADWLSTGVTKLLSKPNVGLVGGKVEILYDNADRPTPIELLSGTLFWRQRESVEVAHYSATANMFARRAIFESVGYFDADLKSQADIVWGRLVYAAGYELIYAEDARVGHPSSSFREVCSRVMRQAGGKYDRRRRRVDSYRTDIGDEARQFTGYLIQILSDVNIRWFGDKISVLVLLHLALLLFVWERARLHLGGSSRR